MKRRAPLRRKTSLKSKTPNARKTRTKPVKKVNVKRKAKEFARTYHSRARVLWVQDQPCCVCGRTPSQNCHIETGGMRRKANYDKVVSMCHECHTTYGTPSTHKDWFAAQALLLEGEWQAHLWGSK